MADKLTHKKSGGIVPDENIKTTPPAIDLEKMARLAKINDLTGTVSDALDALGVVGCVAASRLLPTLAGKTIVGRAITVRQIPQRGSSYIHASNEFLSMNELEGINQASPGDVLVIQGVPEVSNMGGMVATIAKRHGLVGAIVDGGVRDVSHSRSVGFPIWAKDFTPVTGKYRIVTEEVNGPVCVGGVTVHAGDLVVADDTGICFVPQEHIDRVLEACAGIGKDEAGWIPQFEAGMSIPDIMKMLYKQLQNK